MRSWKSSLLAAAFAISALIPAGHAFATAEPEITPEATPLLTSPAYCSAEPANINRILEIAGSSIENEEATIPGELIPLDGADMVTGVEAGAIVDLANAFIACLNANDELRALSLLTDDFIKRAAYDIIGSDFSEDIGDGSEPTPADEQVRIAAATAVYQLADGRFAYLFDIGPVTGESGFARLQLIAVEVNGEYKIDDLRFLDTEIEEPDCGSTESDGCLPPVEASPVTGDGYTGWIMTADQANEAALYFNIDETKYSGFEVTEEQIAEAEAALPGYAADQPRATQRLISGLDDGTYERQYFGYAYEFSFLLVINGYCPDAYQSPAQYPVIVMDGGDCFWQATYDLTSQKFVSFSVNGDA